MMTPNYQNNYSTSNVEGKPPKLLEKRISSVFSPFFA